MFMRKAIHKDSSSDDFQHADDDVEGKGLKIERIDPLLCSQVLEMALVSHAWVLTINLLFSNRYNFRF